MKAKVLYLAMVLALLLSLGIAAMPTTVSAQTSVNFSQMDFNLDGNITTDSSWGAATIVYEPDGAIMYINLVVNETWVIQNLPLMPVGNEFVLDFDLGVENGTEVTQLEYAYNITTSQLVTMPSDFQIANVTDGSVVMYSGEIGETANFSIPGALIGGLPVDWAWHDEDDIFNQPCGLGECVPAAISNSLKLLKKKHNLNMKDVDISIAKMKGATGWQAGPPRGAPFGWWNTKKTNVDKNLPIVTTIYDETVDLDKIIKEIRRGQDVELRVPGHAAMVTGIIKLANGKYIFGVAHDTNQGPSGNGGEEAQSSVYDPDTKKFTGGKWINGKGLSRIIVECPIFSTSYTIWQSPGVSASGYVTFTHNGTVISDKWGYAAMYPVSCTGGSTFYVRGDLLQEPNDISWNITINWTGACGNPAHHAEQWKEDNQPWPGTYTKTHSQSPEVWEVSLMEPLPAVGGIVELPQIKEPGAVTPDSSGHNYGALAGIIVGAIVGTIMLISAVWYVRRRRTKAI